LAGGGMLHNQRWELNGVTVRGSHFNLFLLGGSQDNISINNNYFGACTEWAFYILRNEFLDDFVSDNNTFDCAVMGYVIDTDTTYTTLEDWQGTGQDLNSN